MPMLGWIRIRNQSQYVVRIQPEKVGRDPTLNQSTKPRLTVGAESTVYPFFPKIVNF